MSTHAQYGSASSDDYRIEDAFASLDEEDIAEAMTFGRVEEIHAGQILFEAGDATTTFLLVLDGEVELRGRGSDGDDVTIRVFEAGNFIGELNLLTGQRRVLTAQARTDGHLLVVESADFHRMMSTRATLADTIFRIMSARREFLREGDGSHAIEIIGSRYSPEAMALRGFATRSHLAHSWIDVEELDPAEVSALLERKGSTTGQTPVVVLPTGVLERPTPGVFAAELGLTFQPVPDYIFDLVVVGVGPAGLASAVYGASEGLSTVALDADGTGGQAGSSSRIENYVGFPNGISGEELSTRAAIQAQRLGAQINAPCEVACLRTEPGFHVIQLADGSEIPCRAVIVASGARYQRLAVADLEQYEGAGVYYAATDLEARLCAGEHVIVVGGGNSAGQAAIYLAQQGCDVTIAIRGDDLAKSMSRYLIERIDAEESIELRTRTEVRELIGDGRLERVVVEETATGERLTVPCTGLFCFIGADPATEWLGGNVALDPKGFVLTDVSLPAATAGIVAPTARSPFPFESSVPGVFAVGDVRHGSLKRVAAAVGEGSSAVRAVHDYLAATS